MGSDTIPLQHVHQYVAKKAAQGHSHDDITTYLNIIGYKPSQIASQDSSVTNSAVDNKNIPSHTLSKDAQNDIAAYLDSIGYMDANSNAHLVSEGSTNHSQISKKGSSESVSLSQTHKNEFGKSSTVTQKPAESKSTTILKLISYLQLAIKQEIPKLTIYAHLIKHGWDKMLIEKAYAVALNAQTHHSDKPFTVVEANDALKKDSKFLLSQIDELSAAMTQKKETMMLEKERVKQVEEDSFHTKLNSKYTASHFYSKIKTKLGRELIKKQLAQNSLTKEQLKQKEHLEKLESELALLERRMLENPPAQQYAQPPQIIREFVGQPSQQNTSQTTAASQPLIIQSHKTQEEQQAPSEPIKPSKEQLAQVATLAKESASYTKPAEMQPMTINAASINVISGDKGSSGNFGGGVPVHNHYHEEGGELGLYNPLIEKEFEFVDTEVEGRVQIGIPDLDGVISGGLMPLTTTLVSGGAGTGKSTFGLQYLVNGITMHNEPGIYITFEQTREAVLSLGNQFGWDLEHLESEGMLIIHEYTPEQISKALQAGGGSVRDMVDSISAKRIVLDSITEYKMLYPSEIEQRKELTSLFKSFTKWGCTAIVIGQEHSESRAHVSSVLDYESDAVILLYNERRGDIRQRSLEIYKMRDTKHAGRIFPMEITDKGMVVHTKETKLIAGRR